MRGWRIMPMATIVISILGIGLIAGCSQGAAKDEQFYKGKTLTWVVSSTAGSGTDLVVRAIAPHLAKEIGATVRVENMGSEEGDNFVYAEAKRDGLTILAKSSDALISNDILKAPGIRYDIEKFIYLADVYRTTKVFQTSPKLPYKTVDALRQAKGLKAAGTSARGALVTSAAAMFDILGLDGKVVSGYAGKNDVVLALARGEVDIMVPSDNTAAKDENDGSVINLFAVSKERSRLVPNVPTMAEFGVKVPNDKQAVYEYVAATGNAAALPPDVPQDRVEYLRKVFLKLNDNKDLHKDIERLTGVWTPFVAGKQLQEEVSTIKANKAVASQLDAIFAKYKAIQ